MRTTQKSLRIVSAVVGIGIVAVLVAGCTRAETTTPAEGGSDPGISDDSLSLGITLALSGPVATSGACYYGAMNAFFEAGNADGGFEFGDGKTRKVSLKSYDDAFDPAKAVSNVRQMIAEDLFGSVGSLGTPTQAAVMPIANQEEFPQALLQTGADSFSVDQEKSPWTIGFLPSYFSEGESFGKMLADENKPLTVAVLQINNDYGNGYVNGLKSGIEGSQVTIAESATFEASDTSVDGQMTRLAATNADVFFSADSQAPLVIASLQKAQSVGWLPQVFLPSNISSKGQILDPSNASVFDSVYTTIFTKDPGDPQFANDESVKTYLANMKEYASNVPQPEIAQCVQGYVAAETTAEAFKNMTEPTRESFMAGIREIADFEAPLLWPGVVADATDPTKPAINSVQVVKWDGTAYAPVS